MATLDQLTTELAQVNAALTAAYGASEYEVRDGNSSRRLKRQDIKVLEARRATLELSISRMTGDGRGVSFGMTVDNTSVFNR